MMIQWLVCVALGVGAWDDPQRPARVASAEETLREWARTFKTSRVADMVAFYEDSREVAAWESTGKARKGTAAIRKMYEEAFDEVIFEQVTVDTVEVRQNGGVAWVTCRFKADTVLRADRSRWTMEVRASFVLQKGKDAWKIAFEHFSPIDGVPRVQPRK
jgi:ketosteroid isomerase-like protein